MPGCRGNAVRMDGVNGNGQEAAEQLQVSSAPVAGETGTGQLSCCFCGFYLLAAARVICLPLWGWIATKELKKQLLCQQRVGSLKASELEERKLDDQRAESTHEISPCFTHAAPLESAEVWEPSARYGGVEDASSSEKSSCRQTLLTNRPFCAATVGLSDFLLVGRDYSSGFGFSDCKPLA